ncbi:hypothetical protein [Gluconobacter frateurii]|uniref:Uncharacterized protein n=1 Tax=Gluconobacter frateurii NRIC 0228 TaxID=1307946 RepID=A0ABQ0QF59_9PROT|nr:hypothetical protein [Gluconobacter frateurii]GBR16594.1 hypothetical protein AA0228_2814 [Gluconobacter frateurii NRIC 0228]GLP90612.1 hypothetical protein GCM10007868_16870 [Gluconobacter frateurii]
MVREIRLTGHFDPEALQGFAMARAELLAVEITKMSVSQSRFEARIVGEEALLGMFEMSCLLGPAGCIVTGAEDIA